MHFLLILCLKRAFNSLLTHFSSNTPSNTPQKCVTHQVCVTQCVTQWVFLQCACFERFETHNVVGDGGATTGRPFEASGQLPSEKVHEPPPPEFITIILMAAQAALNAHLEKRHWDWS